MLSRILSKIIPISFFVLLLFLPTGLYAEDESTSQNNQEFKSLVPSLLGLTLTEVQLLLPQYDLVLGSVLEEVSEGEEGKVISQDQEPDTNVTRFTTINVSIAISPESINRENTPKPTEVTTVTEIVLPEPEEIVENPESLIDESTGSDLAEVQGEKETKLAPPVNQTEEESIEGTEAIVTVSSEEEKTEKVEETIALPDANEEKEAEVAVSNVNEEKDAEVVVVSEAPDEKIVESNNEVEEEKSDTVEETNPLESDPYNGRKLSFTLDPEGYIQVTRKITMTMQLSPPADNANMQYQFNISGKSYNSPSPVFTHVFDEEETVILTASARLPGKAWLHSESRRVNVGKYVPRKIKVPNIVGLNENKAAELLKKEGLVVGNTRDKIVKGGSGIIEQMPKAGTIRTEDDNKIHYVRAIDEKFQVQVLAKNEGLETGSVVSIEAQVKPKPRSSKTRYSFSVNDEVHHSSSPKWQYIFKESGNVKVIAKAIINGEGTFESEPITLAVANEWKKPTAVISPYTISVEAGETVTFESASAYDVNGVPQLLWSDGIGNTSTASKFVVNTQELSVGEHAVTLKVTDERDYEDIAKAQLIIIEKKVALPEDALSQPDQTEKVLDEESASEKPVTEPEDKSKTGEEVAEVKTTGLQTMDTPLGKNEVSQESGTALFERESADGQKMTSTMTHKEDINWGVWIWVFMIATVLFPILWIINKLRGKAIPKESIVTTESPYSNENSEKDKKVKVVSSRANRFAKLGDATPTTPKSSGASSGKTKQSANPDLVDFDLDVKPSSGKSKKDELTDFKLDD